MDRKKLLLLLAAVIVAAGAALLARSMFSSAAAPAQAAVAKDRQGPRVLVARRTLNVGTIVSADAVAFQPWPADLIQDAYYLSDSASMDKLLGTVVRHAITAGEPVTKDALVSPGDRGFLAAALMPGMRAVTVPVSARTGGGGFIFPGDRVDVVLTQTVKGAEPQELNASETIVRNVRVLATDQSTENTVVNGKPEVREVKTVTLEATPRIAEQIAVAQVIGTLSLSLRSLADSAAELDRVIEDSGVALPEDLNPADKEKLARAALERPLEGGGSFVTGGDVSRFQRRTMPRMSEPRAEREPSPPAPVSMPVRPAAPVTVEFGQAAPGPVVRVTRGKETVVVPVGGQ